MDEGEATKELFDEYGKGGPGTVTTVLFEAKRGVEVEG